MARRATWQDARRHGVIKVPLSMGNCNPPFLSYSASRSRGGEDMYIRADYRSRYTSIYVLSLRPSHVRRLIRAAARRRVI